MKVYEIESFNFKPRTSQEQGKKIARSHHKLIDPKDRPFIAWDGEGVNLLGEGYPQSYVLFGSSEGYIENRSGLSTFECLDHILETGKANPTALHCGFAFNYDSNMILKSLAPATLARLKKDGYVTIKRKSTGEVYVLTYTPGKFFRVTKRLEGYDFKTNHTAKITVMIYDIFSFFATSFEKAYRKNVGPVPAALSEGKARRKSFSIEEFDYILRYWQIEIQMLRELAEELRRRVYSAGLMITQWYGPGALSSYAMKQHNIKDYMKENSPEIRLAARYAYAAGRFEQFETGRIAQKVYGFDLNSAYPYAISMLPSMRDGEWRYEVAPRRISRFGIYKIRMRRNGGFSHPPSPVFHRDKAHMISFPWYVSGWYYGPEAALAIEAGAEVLEGWHYTGSRTRPFAWITDMYAQRKEWQAQGISAELALKLCMNSAYGKLAQRVGWDEKRQQIPSFHQLEWAGWVTSYTRASIFKLISRIPFGQLIAVETDGVYTTATPEELGIVDSKELGGWGVSSYDEVMYLQSGLAWLRKGDEWTSKRRGLDGCRQGHNPVECTCSGVFTLRDSIEYLRMLEPKERWGSYVGETTRFIGLTQALASSRGTRSMHCLWETRKREIKVGQVGKRVHIHRMCKACQEGKNGYEGAHNLVIRSMSGLQPVSTPHSIPWEPGAEVAPWRESDEYLDETQYVE